jgi:hypothetical protein
MSYKLQINNSYLVPRILYLISYILYLVNCNYTTIFCHFVAKYTFGK